MPKHAQLRPQQSDPSPASRPDKRLSSHAPSPIQAMASASPQVQAATQLQAQVSAHVGPPAQLKSPDGLPPAMRQNMERASGFDLSGVRVHRNSTLPAQLQAHAFAQGGHIHLAPGQDKHLPHEAWHVVQQAQGRVKPTHTVAGQPVNLDNGLEAEASRLGSQHSNESTQQGDSHPAQLKTPSHAQVVAQRVVVQIHWGVSKAMQPVPINSNDNNSNSLNSNNNNTNNNDSNIKNTNNSQTSIHLNNNNNNGNNSNSSDSLVKTSSSNRYSYNPALFQHNYVNKSNSLNNNSSNNNNSNNIISNNNNSSSKSNYSYPYSNNNANSLNSNNNSLNQGYSLNNPYVNRNSNNISSNFASNNNNNSNNFNNTLINHPSDKFISHSHPNNGNTFNNNNINSSNNTSNILISNSNKFIHTNQSNFKNNFHNSTGGFLIINDKDFISDNTNNKESQKNSNKMILDNKQAQDPSNDKTGQSSQQQLHTQKKEEPTYIITRVQFAGRPPRLFGSSMGDHTTSYSVHEKGIEAAIIGKDLRSATNYMKGRIDQDHKLPGMMLTKNWGGNGNAIEAHLQDLKNLFQAIDNDLKNPTAQGPLILQQLIATYLEFRELIPLSAINVAAKFPALAGKGKGEFTHVNTLQSYEMGKTKDTNGLMNAIANLLDVKAIALLAAELNPLTKSNMAPGLNTNWKYDIVLKTILTQHLMTIQTSFPKAFKDAGIDNLDQAVGAMYQKALPFLKAAIQDEVAYTKADITTTYNHKDGAYSNYNLLSNTRKINFLKTQKGQAWKREVDGYDEKIKSLTDSHNQLTQYLDETDLKDINADKDTLDELSVSRSKSKDKTNEKDTPLDGRLATAIMLNNDGTIRNIHIEGRPSSPFGGQGHGAHTTAWVVHVQVIRTSLIGVNTSEAIQRLFQLCHEAENHAQAMLGQMNILQVHQSNLNTARSQVEAAKKIDPHSPQQFAPALQSLISAYLVLVNMTPGSAFTKGNTDGHHESDSNDYLLNYNQNSNPNAGLWHMVNLLDLDGNELHPNNPAKQDIEENIITRHLLLLKRAYPVAYKAIEPQKKRSAFQPDTRIVNHNKAHS